MIVAMDSGIPQRSVAVDVQILITRDEFDPEFEQSPSPVQEIPEDRRIGERVYTFVARDRDQKVCVDVHVPSWVLGKYQR